MKHSNYVLLFLMLVITPLFGNTDPDFTTSTNSTRNADNIPIFSDKELEMHMKQMYSDVVVPRLNDAVKSYIKTYTVKTRERTATMLGRTAMYFSMFEKYAIEKNVPTDLKYLSIVESALDPHAESRSGAVGLWQFMPETGSSMGLKINREVDERKDPHKSTKAAYEYLTKQYKRYENWELALAAYNGGPGRVNRAIKRGRSKNFWKIRKYLPRETQNYVPAFIGATYISHYHDLYNIAPTPVGPNLSNTALTTVRKSFSFREISDITGTPFYIIAILNPSYKKLYIPGSSSGNNLVLPQADMIRFLNHIGRPDHKLEQLIASRVAAPGTFNKEDFLLISHEVAPGQTLDEIAEQYNQSPDNIIKWNKLNKVNLRPGQRIMLFVEKRPTENLKYQPIENLDPLTQKHFSYQYFKYNVSPGAIPQIDDAGKYSNLIPDNENDYEFYRLKRRETLMDVLAKFPELTMEELMDMNDFDRYSKIRPGQKLIIGVR